MAHLNRRHFIKVGALAGTTLAASPKAFTQDNAAKPVVISTWDHGLDANKVAWKLLADGSRGIDAIQQGVMVVESDPLVRTVGIGGFPDQDGKVTLDACIMDENGNCGSVAFLQHIKNPIAVARLVMENTPHVMLAGEGALQFALKNGFDKENLLTEESIEDWKAWKRGEKRTGINRENHDTISSLALDSEGNLSGVCTTSGASFKMHGRVGDSPIIGAGLFVDNEVGAAAATGLGEAVMKVAGSAMVVEAMRNGKTPQEACEMIARRIVSKTKDLTDLQVGFIALDKKGNHGAFSIYDGFSYAFRYERSRHQLKTSSFIFPMPETD